MFIQAAGTATPSVAAKLISKLEEDSTEEDQWVARAIPGSLYLAGADTVSSSRIIGYATHH